MPVMTHRERRVRRLIRLMVTFLCALFLAVFLLASQLPSQSKSSVGSSSSKELWMRSSSSLRLKTKTRIAIIIPFVAQGPESIPPYLNVFCAGAAGIQDVADVLIFHNGVLDAPTPTTADSTSQTKHKETTTRQSLVAQCPSNVKFISLGSTLQLARLLLKVVLDFKDEHELAFDSKQKLELLVTKHILVYPYSLVEFKPAYGYIFQDYLHSYSHWGYSDVDLLMGDLGRWIDSDEWTEYDIVTYGYGDQQRVYLRGQFTFHKNSPNRINLLWRECDYLTNLDQRLADVVHKAKKYRFESAEGCYSAAVLKQTDIRVKYAVKAWTDVKQDDTAGSHGLYFSRHGSSGRGVIYKATDAASGNDLLRLSPNWWEEDSVYMNRKEPLQKPAGEIEEIALPNNPDAKCMYWVQSKYQQALCLSDKVQHNENLFWIHGKLYKRAFETVKLESNVQTGPFFHFQEWKRYYRSSQLASLHVHSPMSTFVLTKEGAIPVLDTYKQPHSPAVPSPLKHHLKRWKPISMNERSGLPRESYCLLSGPRKIPPKPAVPECFYQVSWHDELGMEILAGGLNWGKINVELDVTLVLTLQITEGQARNPESLSVIIDMVVENLSRWQGRPAVAVIHIAGVTDDGMGLLRRRFDPAHEDNQSNPSLAGIVSKTLLAVVYQEEDNVVSRKALLNMALDAVPTRWYISGLELERGLVLSTDTVFYAHQVPRVYLKEPGRVFVVPQFAYDGDLGRTDLRLSELREASVHSQLKAPSAIEKSCDSDANERSDKAEVLWWAQVEALLSEEENVDIDLGKKADWTQNMELGYLEFLTNEHHVSMFGLDESTILLTDNVGPHPGMRTDEFAREVEQLGGRRCYNGLRLAQLSALGYKFDVLAGAFAVSTEKSRDALAWGIDNSVAGSSRCDGCFMFVDEHEDILEDIIKDEIIRVGKTAVVWDELNLATRNSKQ